MVLENSCKIFSWYLQIFPYNRKTGTKLFSWFRKGLRPIRMQNCWQSPYFANIFAQAPLNQLEPFRGALTSQDLSSDTKFSPYKSLLTWSHELTTKTKTGEKNLSRRKRYTTAYDESNRKVRHDV